MSAILFLPLVIELQGEITAFRVGEAIMFAGLIISLINMRRATKKDHKESLEKKADKAYVDEELSDKIGRREFDAHVKDNEKQHKDIIYVRGKVDDIYTHLLGK